MLYIYIISEQSITKHKRFPPNTTVFVAVTDFGASPRSANSCNMTSTKQRRKTPGVGKMRGAVVCSGHSGPKTEVLCNIWNLQKTP